MLVKILVARRNVQLDRKITLMIMRYTMIVARVEKFNNDY